MGEIREHTQHIEHIHDKTNLKVILGTILLFADLLLLFIFNLFFIMQWVAGNYSFFQVVKYIYMTSTFLAPIIFLIVGSFVILCLCRLKRDLHLLLWGGTLSIFIALFLFGIRAYATYYEPYNLQTNTIEIRCSKIYRSITLLHISDIQSPKIGWYEERVFDQIKQI